jgi:hypothetical protein
MVAQKIKRGTKREQDELSTEQNTKEGRNEQDNLRVKHFIQGEAVEAIDTSD